LVCGASHDSESFCLLTEDGGASWRRSELPARLGIGLVALSRGNGAWATATFGPRHGGLLSSDDAGETWSVVPIPRLAEETRLGGLTRASSAPDWGERPIEPPVGSSPTPSPSFTPSEIVPRDRPRAWIAGDTAERSRAISGVVLRSDDGGESWVEVFAAAGGSFSSVDFVDRETGWVAGAGRVFRSDDAGATFVDQTDGIDVEGEMLAVRTVAAADAARAALIATVVPSSARYAWALDTLLFTADGGTTWQPAQVLATLPEQENLIGGRMCLTNRGAGVAIAGPQVLLTSDGGASWHGGPRFEFQVGSGGSVSRGRGFNSPTLSCSGDSDLWIAVGAGDPRGETLWHSPDGGETWEDLTAVVGRGFGTFLTGGAFADSGAGWLVLDEEGRSSPGRLRLVATRNRGETWIDLSPPLIHSEEIVPGALVPEEYPEAIALADDSGGILVMTPEDASGPSSAVFTRDGGATWNRSELPAGFHPLASSYVP
jgi:photosystem II stability/assembly factor-like uncharacterized protein